jgi:peptidoglycan/LPS O-acetylase OafA/YrhL
MKQYIMNDQLVGKPKQTRENKLLKLEAIRGAAALYVVLHHTIRDASVLGYDLSFLFRFGQEAVILFFILSGFVIEYSFKRGSDKTFTTYFVKRLLRIYIPLVLVYLANYFILYVQQSGVDVPWGQVVLNILMLQDLAWIKPNVIVAPLFGNSPLWSLSYEWWFYTLYFPIVHYFPRNSSKLVFAMGLLSALTYVVYPNFINRELMYLVIWWSGVVIARLYADERGVQLVRLLPVLVVLAIISIVLGLYAHMTYAGKGVGISPVLEVRHFTFSILALLFALGWKKINWFMFETLLGVFTRLAPVSFGIYISHYFLVTRATYLDGVLPASPIFSSLAYFTVCVGFSYLIERVIYVRINSAYRRRIP